MGWDTDRAKELAADEEWELVDKVAGPYRCVLSHQMVPAGSWALRIRGKTSGGTLIVGQGVARDYFGIGASRLDELLISVKQAP